MFTADGRLREEYQHLDGSADPSATPARAEPFSTPAEEPVREPTPPEPQTPQEAPLSKHPPTLFELISLLAEPAAAYLQQSRIPDGQSAEHLELARLHIDLLGLIKQKTAGNLSSQEQMALDETLLQLRQLALDSRS